MNDLSTDNQRSEGRYEIRFEGHLAPGWAAWFDGMSVTSKSDGTTVLAGPVIDQAALHGLLTRLRDIGLPLVSVKQLDADLPHRPPLDPFVTPHN